MTFPTFPPPLLQADVEGSLRDKDDGMRQAQRKIQDLATSNAMLHERIEQQQRMLEEVASLKAKLSVIMADVDVPILNLSTPGQLRATAGAGAAGRQQLGAWGARPGTGSHAQAEARTLLGGQAEGGARCAGVRRGRSEVGGCGVGHRVRTEEIRRAHV